MRHRKSGRKLNMSSSHRSALFRNMAKALLTYGKIRTTVARAKELRGVVEPLITLALRNDLHARRQAYKVLGSHQLVKQLFDEIGPRFIGIPGGYTRVLKLGDPRPGDNAPMAIIELTRAAGESVAPQVKAAAPVATAEQSVAAPEASPIETADETSAELTGETAPEQMREQAEEKKEAE